MHRQATITVAAGALAFTLVACAGSSSQESGDRAGPNPTATPISSTLEERVEAELKITDQPDWIVAGYDGVWVARDEAARVDRIDPATNEVVASVKVGGHPTNGIVAAFGSIWVPSCDKEAIARVDPSTNQVTSEVDVPVFCSTYIALAPEIAAGEGAVWSVTEGQSGAFDTLARIDPSSERVEDRIPLGHVSSGVAVGEGAVWVAAPDDGVVLKVDPDRDRVVEEIEGFDAPSVLAAGHGRVWVLSGNRTDRSAGDGTLTPIDPTTDEPGEPIQIDETGGQAGDLTIGEGLVWVRTQFTLLAGVDPETGTIVDRITDQKGLGGVAVGFGSVWLSDFGTNFVWRVRPPG